MRAIRLQKPHQLEALEIAEPGSPGPGQALVATHRMGVCGTDIKAFLGKQPFIEYPLIPGHELGLEVLEVGDGVSPIRPGDRVCVEPYLNCGECYACRQGAYNCCLNNRVLGVRTDGGLCDRFVVRADKLHRSDKLSYDQLALVETLAIGCHAVARGLADLRQRQGLDLAKCRALIIGAGPIGLATLEFVRQTGMPITVMDQQMAKLEFARERYGVDSTILARGDGLEVTEARAFTAGDLYPVIFDATGSKASMAGAHEFAAATGTIVYVGIAQEPIPLAQPPHHWKELTLRMSRNALPADFTEVIRLIEAGKIDTDAWISHRVPFAEVVSRFDSLTQPETGVLKAMIEVR